MALPASLLAANDGAAGPITTGHCDTRVECGGDALDEEESDKGQDTRGVGVGTTSEMQACWGDGE